uniref:C-type cytochrome n=1 Tax=Aromatoleum anaerobium TaxID=182180 RepID=A0ABX1PQH3_9RHOO
MLVVLAFASSLGEAGAAPRGEEIYARCLACHALAYHRTGPRHCGLFGRRAGSLPDYEYSDAMRKSGIVWDAATLDRFLAAPTRVVPGTTMGYAGIPDPAERAALIEWLREASRSGMACPENP